MTATLTVTNNGFSYTDLVANVSGTGARTVDSSLEDPWGIAWQAKLPAVIANRESNTSTAYDGSGAKKPVGPAPAALVVHLPTAAGGASFSPTGVAAPADGGFTVTKSGKSAAAQLVYAGESGLLAAWSPAVDPANAIEVYAASDGAVYRGLAVGPGTLYATDFRNGKIDVFNSTFQEQPHSSTSYPFVDPELPAGYAPFGISVGADQIGALNLYVTYARRLANGQPMNGAGLGLVDIFDLAGNFVTRLVAPGGVLNAPWGVTLAEGNDFDIFGRQLFVANTGDGRIHVFNPTSGALVGTVSDSAGVALAIPSVHGISFGNRYANQPDASLFFTAGTNATTGT